MPSGTLRSCSRRCADRYRRRRTARTGSDTGNHTFRRDRRERRPGGTGRPSRSRHSCWCRSRCRRRTRRSSSWGRNWPGMRLLDRPSSGHKRRRTRRSSWDPSPRRRIDPRTRRSPHCTPRRIVRPRRLRRHWAVAGTRGRKLRSFACRSRVACRRPRTRRTRHRR
jgi:hypothetical protein